MQIFSTEFSNMKDKVAIAEYQLFILLLIVDSPSGYILKGEVNFIYTTNKYGNNAFCNGVIATQSGPSKVAFPFNNNTLTDLSFLYVRRYAYLRNRAGWCKYRHKLYIL